MDCIIYSQYSSVEKIDTYLNSENFRGSILISRNSTIEMHKSYGFSDTEHTIANTNKTKYNIASLSKAFAAAAILQLCERKQLNLHDQISKYIIYWPCDKNFTIHHLLTHTSGIIDIDHSKINLDVKDPQAGIITLIKESPLEFEPGTKLKYSNAGYILLAYLVELISKQTFEEFLNENIFTKLNMHDTFCDYHEKTINKGCGGIYSTTEDLFKWCKSFDTEFVLKKESMSQIFTKHFQDQDFSNSHWGYGWVLDKFFNKSFAFHTGKTIGFSSVIFKFLDEDICVILLSNSYDTQAFKLAFDLAKIILDL